RIYWPFPRTWKLNLTGVGSITPARIALTAKVWCPGFSAAVVKGEWHGLKWMVSTAHWKPAPGRLELKRKVGVWCRVLFGGFANSLVWGDGSWDGGSCGGVARGTATEKVKAAGLRSTLWLGSIARTRKVWGPLARSV